MKKIFLLFAAACAFVACSPNQEDIDNAGHITLEELLAKTTVKTDKSADGQNGNIITCETLAPVNARWIIGSKQYVSNSARQKMRIGEYNVSLTALCPDGTQYTADFPITCDVETDPIKKVWIYGEDPAKQPEFWLEPGDAAGGRFSNNEGKYLPYLDKETYFGFKTLVFQVTAVEEGPFIWGDGVGDVGLTMRIMNGWWSTTYQEDAVPTLGYWELPITEAIANECALQDDGGQGKDLDLLMTRGKIKIKAVYYEI